MAPADNSQYTGIISMDDSRHQDGAGAALVALVVVILLVVAVAAYYWISRRALFERERATIAEQEAQAARETSKTFQGGRLSPQEELGIGRHSEPPDLNELLVEVFEAMQDLYFIDKKRAAIKFAIDLIADKIPCKAVAGLSITADNPDEMIYVTAHGDGVDPIIGRRTPLRGTLLGLSVRQGVAVAVSDAQNDSRVKAELEHLIDKDTRSVLCVPFTFEGRTFGAAELVNRQGGDSWRQGEIHIVSYVANHLSEYIAQSLDSHEDFEADFAKPSPPPSRLPQPVANRPAQPKQKKSAKHSSHSKKARKKRKKR
jgi:GAF domain-containing protein